MKRILFAAIISLGLHGFLFSMETKWLAGINPARPKTGEITISLSYQQQKKPAIRPSAKPKHILKKRPQKKIDKPLDIEKKEIAVEPESLPEPEEIKPAKEPEEVYFDSAPDLSHTSASTTFDQKTKIPDAQTILEARPIYRINPPPSYPVIARKRGYQGNVTLEVLINKQGKVIDLKVYASSGYSMLDKTAAAAVKKWLFQPGMRGSEKIEMWVRVPIRFKLN